jgi:RHS repeat-associated protein
LPLQLLETGFSLVTSPLAKLMPGFPAGVITAPYLGMPHAHEHPPSDFVPLPSIGATFGAGGVSVLIGGLPAARASDLGIAPTCGSFFPLFDIQTGSSNTFICGARASRMLIDSTFHCAEGEEAGAVVSKFAQVASKAGMVVGVAGVAASVLSAGAQGIGAESDSKSSDADTRADSSSETTSAVMTGAQAAADALNLALSAMLGKDPGLPPSKGVLLFGNPTVLIGGLPLPNALAMLGMLKALKRSKRPKEPEFNEQVPKCDRVGHPVNPVTGASVNEFSDYDDDGPLAFHWERNYDSRRNDQDGPLGYGFRHNFQQELTLLRTRAIYTDGEMRKIVFPRQKDGSYGGVSAGYELTQRDQHRFKLRHDDHGELGFECDTASSARIVSQVTSTVRSRFDYNERGRLRRIVQSAVDARTLPIFTAFTYDSNGHMVRIERGPAHAPRVIMRYTYDIAGCLHSWHDRAGASGSHAYDQHRRMIRETDRNGFSFSYEYDVEGRCIASAGQDNIWRVGLRYEPGRTFVTQADGGEWVYHHDAFGNLIRIVDPYGGATDKVLGDDGRIIQEIDSGGRTMHWLYDGKGRNTGRQDRWANVWPPKDQAPKLPNPLAHKVAQTPLGQQWGIADTGAYALGNMPVAVDNLVRKVLVVPQVVASEPQIEFDAAGRIVEKVDIYGRQENYTYDAEGNVLSYSDKDRREYRYQTVSWNLQGVEIDPLGHSVRRAYTLREQIGAVVDANGNKSSYTYDHKDRITSVTRHGALRETYSYDIGDRLSEKRDANGDVLLRFQVGSNGLHSRRILTSGDTHYFEYDERGRFTSASTEHYDVRMRHNRLGQRTLDKRDGLGITRDHRGTQLANSTYFERFAVEYQSMRDGEMHIRTPDGSRHRIQRVHDGRILTTLGNGSHAAYRFDQDERCVGRVRWRSERTEAAHWVAYRYSPAGELRHIVDSEQGQINYQYDAAHRLIGETRNGRPVRHYEYDPGGNLTASPAMAGLLYIEGNRLHSTPAGRYVYNHRNHLAEQIDPSGKATRYRYNSMDLQVEIGWDDRQETWQAEYDGLCRRISKTYGGQRTEYYWDGDRLAAERMPDGKLRLYVYANTDALLPFMFIDYESMDAAPETGTPYFTFCNQVGLPERIEDMHGEAVWQAQSIDPYGYIEVAPGNKIDYHLRWPGHYFDPETDLHYNRFRSYSPLLGRYLQSDPMGQAGGINLYAYTANPLVLVDVLGLHDGTTDANSGNERALPGSDAEDPETRLKNAEEKYQNALEAHNRLAKEKGHGYYETDADFKIKTALDDAETERAAAQSAVQLASAEGKRFTDIDEFNRAANSPEKNSKYIYGSYVWETDSLGRVSSVQGVIDLTAHNRDYTDGVKTTSIGKSSGVSGDVGFHLIGDQFNGPINRLNVVPGNGVSDGENMSLNLSGYKTWEGNIAKLAENKTVEVQIQPVYNAGNLTTRPDSFNAMHRVNNGEWVTRVFRNVAGGEKP